MATTRAPITVDSETDALISHAAHFVRSCQKDVVSAAISGYVENHRDELQEAALDALRTLDGSTKSAVQLLTGASGEELDEPGGFSNRSTVVDSHEPHPMNGVRPDETPPLWWLVAAGGAQGEPARSSRRMSRRVC